MPRSPDRSAWRPRPSSSGSGNWRSAASSRATRRASTPRRVGLPLLAFIFVRDEERPGEERTSQLVSEIPEVLEVHHVAGEDCLLVKVRATDTDALGRLLRDRLGRIPTIVTTRTTIVLGTVKESSQLPLPLPSDASERGVGGARPCLRSRPASRIGRSPRRSRSSRPLPRCTCSGARPTSASASRWRRFRRSSLRVCGSSSRASSSMPGRGGAERSRRRGASGAARRSPEPSSSSAAAAASSGPSTSSLRAWPRSSLQPNPCPSCCWRPCAAAVDRTGSFSPASPWAQRASSFSSDRERSSVASASISAPVSCSWPGPSPGRGDRSSRAAPGFRPRRSWRRRPRF